MTNITGTIINDCADDLARARQELRFESLFGVRPTFVGVGSYEPIEAAGNLLDALDVLVNFPLADQEQQNIVLVNVAPRGEDVKEQWDNGTPFCYFRIGNTLVVSTYAGPCLALARDHGIVSKVELVEVPKATAAAVEWGDLTPKEAEKINHSQFRSLEFLPLVAFWLWKGKPVPSKTQSLAEMPRVSGRVWHVDNFDNAKTTLLPKDVDFADGKRITLANGQVATCYRRLADVPKGEAALTIGSSGFGPNRFLELAIGHRGRAATAYKLAIGAPILADSFVNNTLNR